MNNSYYLVLEAYPVPSDLKEGTSGGAIIGCWIRQDMSDTTQDATALATERLSANWVVTRCLEAMLVDASTYSESTDGGGDYFAQSLSDGFTAHVRAYPREVVAPFDELGHLILDRNELGLLRNAQWFTLTSNVDGQWANGVTPGEENFVPLWVVSHPASQWLDCWPDHQVANVAFDELVGTVLPGLVSTGYSVGVSRDSSAMPILSPAELIAALMSDGGKLA